MTSQPPTSKLLDPELMGAEDARLFGEMVRSQRKAQGLRQEDVANSTGVGRRYVVEMEGGKPTLRIGPALRIARFLGIEPVIVEAQSTTPEEELPEIDPDDLPPLED